MSPTLILSEEDAIERAIELLKQSRDLLKLAGAKRTTDRVRLALTSAGGALRNAQCRAGRRERDESDGTREDASIESLDRDPGEDDGERTECGGCGNSWNIDESTARDPEHYCSATCQRRDGSSLASI